MSDRPLAVATAPRPNTSHWTQRAPMTWDALVAWLDLPNPADKRECGGYVLGQLQETVDNHNGKVAPHSALHRNKEAVVSRCVLVLDADHATPGLLAKVEALGVAAVVHTTWRHTEDAPRYRLLFPLSRDVTPGEYRHIAVAVMHELGWGQFDHSAAEPERFMFRPATQDPDAYDHHVLAGDPLNVTTWLARYVDQQLDAPPPAPAPAPDAAAPVTASPEYAAQVRGEIAWTLGKLDALAALPKDGTVPWPGAKAPDKPPGEVGWDYGTFLAAKRLVEAANAGVGYSLAQAREDFMEHAPGAYEQYNPTHKWEQGVKQTGGAATPARATAADDFGPVPGAAGEDAPPAVLAERYPRLDLAALLDPNRPEREWVLAGLIPAGAQVSLVAQAGTMKSLLALAISCALARGERAFAGVPIPRRRRVCYVDMENTEDDIAERLVALGVRTPEDMDQLVFLHWPPLPALDTPEGGAELLAVCRAYGLAPGDVVVLDSLQRVVDGAENDSDTYRAFYRHTVGPLKKAGYTVIRLDNTGKDADRGARGSSSKRDDVDIELRLSRPRLGELVLRPDKCRISGVQALTLQYQSGTDGRLTFSTDGSAWAAAVQEAASELDRLGLPPTTGKDKAWDRLKDTDRFTREQVRQAVDRRKERAGDFAGGTP